MSIEIIKGVNPVGTIQHVRVRVDGKVEWVKYKVIAVTRGDAFIPNQGGPIVYFELAQKHPKSLQTYITLPLSAFEDRVNPVTKTDVFWQVENGVKA